MKKYRCSYCKEECEESQVIVERVIDYRLDGAGSTSFPLYSNEIYCPHCFNEDTLDEFYDWGDEDEDEEDEEESQ